MYDLRGRVIPERCECGRFMKQQWEQTNDEPDSWQDYWTCSNPVHKPSGREPGVSE